MRESVGALVLLQILMIFIVIFISFLAVSVNYAQAFRIKNRIVTIIEQNEGCSVTSDNYCEGGAGEEIDMFLSNMYYTGGYEVEAVSAGSRGTYYKVYTHLNLDLPILGVIIDNFKITGETRIIYRRDE